MKRFSCILISAAVFLAVLVLLQRINSMTPSLSNSSILPEDINVRTYAVTGYSMSEDQDGVIITLRGVDLDMELALTLADMGAYTLYANSTRLYDYQPDSPYSRSHYILIPGSLADADGTLELYFQSESWGRRTAEILSGRLNAPPKLLVGPSQDAADAYQISAGVICILIGICILLILSCMTLYLCRPRELAFLFLSLVALLRIITMAVNLPAHTFSLSMHAYYQIRPLLVTCPVVFHAAMGIYLLRDSLTPGIRRFFTPATVLLLTALALFLQQVSSRNWYHLFQLFCFAAFFRAAFAACQKNLTGSLLLLGGYSAAAAIIFYVYLVNVCYIAPAGLVLTSISITHFSYMFSLLSCLTVTNLRLIRRFRDAEQLSQALAETNRTLDKKVEERTAALQQAQQQRQNMMLNIFHDLRNPVFVLKGCLRSIRPETEKQQRYKALAEHRLAQLERLIEDLFLIEKLESGKLMLCEDHISLSQLLVSLADSVRLTAPSNITVILSAETDCCVWGDSMRLLQAFQNLTENAVVHMPKGGHLQISLQQEGSQALCLFADEGEGISPADLPHIFDRYYSSGRRSADSSTGLGLAIARELIHLHGGTIRVESCPGKGTTFTVTLPCTPPPPHPEIDEKEEN